ncbi:phosphate signaling complex protein PhoU [Phragmitibacter flavus]|uniref:Phosphate-specific transport system accessory protein PhoU n=1 Tax=Phragmitibacter flavus TaxID=2576071 RepID=A0A5R8KCU2_9BACT|nr:phosphate signaling complex protein PhoU [Phragmitibacter flavus]TLD70057.1 phosphate signaling complex protein PhoU [Phragmitibacter flavus]
MNEPRHILSNFDNALTQLRQNLFKMASLSTQNLNDAVKGLLQRDLDLCNQVIADDEQVDQLEKTIDAEGIAILTRFTPMAQDLRRVVSAMKASSNLERISDQAVNIARRGRKLINSSELPETRMLEPIYSQAYNLLQDAVRSFTEEDMPLATSLKARDRELDQQQNEFIARVTRRMEEDTGHLKDYIDLVFVARFLERAGDHAVNIGEDAVYAGAARDIRHTQ